MFNLHKRRMDVLYLKKSLGSLVAALFLFLALSTESRAEEYFLAKMVKVSDGDTFIVAKNDTERIKVRVYGVDCPEIEQPQGREATAFVLRLFPLGASVGLLPVDVDRYGRTVAIVYLPDGSTLEESLLQAGHAWVYGRYCDRPECGAWLDRESAARRDEAGLWAAPAPVPPWEWRKGVR